MKRILLLIVCIVGFTGALYACEFSFTLISSSGLRTTVSLNTPITIQEGDSYTLHISYYEDHRNCTVTPESTLFMIDESRWRVLRETQPLVLTAPIEWQRESTRLHSTSISFRAQSVGTHTLSVIRLCDRSNGGYEGNLIFNVIT